MLEELQYKNPMWDQRENSQDCLGVTWERRRTKVTAITVILTRS